MTRKLASIAIVVLLLPLIACAPTTTLGLVDAGVAAITIYETQVHGGTWNYAPLANDVASCTTAWSTNTPSQNIACVNKISADVSAIPGCASDVKCAGAIAGATLFFDEAIGLLQKSNVLTATKNGATVAAPVSKADAKAAYNRAASQFNAKNVGVTSKDIEKWLDAHK